jgi:hypothetical protein
MGCNQSATYTIILTSALSFGSQIEISNRSLECNASKLVEYLSVNR